MYLIITWESWSLRPICSHRAQGCQNSSHDQRTQNLCMWPRILCPGWGGSWELSHTSCRAGPEYTWEVSHFTHLQIKVNITTRNEIHWIIDYGIYVLTLNPKSLFLQSVKPKFVLLFGTKIIQIMKFENICILCKSYN